MRIYRVRNLVTLVLLLAIELTVRMNASGEDGVLSQQLVRPNVSSRGIHLPEWPRQVIENLAKHGISFQYSSIHDLSKDPLISAGRSGWMGRYSLDFLTTMESDKLLGWKGGRALIHLKQHQGEFGEGYEGVAQGYSNIDGDSRTTLYELWLEQAFFDNKARVKFGKIDANTEFDVVSTAADFLNSSMGYSPTIMALPTYPEPRQGILVSFPIGKRYSVQAGEFTANEKGKLVLAEAARTWALGANELAGKGTFGYWYLHDSLSDADLNRSGTGGVYGVFEQSVWRGALSEESTPRQLTGFVQYGRGDGIDNPFTLHFGVGGVISGPFKSRSQDASGAAVSWVHFSDGPECGVNRTTEMVVEAYYKVKLTKPLSLVSDLQFFHYPEEIGSHSDFMVLTPRLVMTF